MREAKRRDLPRRANELRRIVAKLARTEQRDSGTASKVLLARLIELLGGDTGAVFLLDADGETLRGAHGVWDWTRSSFRVQLDLWPTVRGTLSAGRATRITREDAQGLECDWFESDGIESCICAPMVARGRAIGMLFVDFVAEDSEPTADELEALQSVANEWAESIAERAPGAGSETRESDSVRGVMSPTPMLIDDRVSVDVAKRLLATHHARHALVVRDGGLVGIVDQSALHASRGGQAVGSVARTSLPMLTATTSAEEAAHIMIETGTDCLPVLESNAVVGVLTRRDLRESGHLPGKRGVDVCLACGNTHDLGAAAEDAMVFCSACLACPPSDSLDALYNTLGGSG